MTDYFIENMIYLHTSNDLKDKGENEDKTDNDDDKPNMKTVVAGHSEGDEFDRNRNLFWWSLIILFSSLSLGTRLHKLDMGNQVCWDEAHFGKFASWYLNRTYFFDVHPPLGKMLIAGMGYLVGYDGTFEFMIGQNFSQQPEILSMRYGSALMGSALVPAAYITAWQLTNSFTAASASSILLLFDTGVTSLSRYILLDQPLILSIACSFYLCVKFKKMSLNHDFSRSWITNLAFIGIALGFAISIKLVGALVVFYVGIATIGDLWNLIGDVRVNLFLFAKHFLFRAVFLILLPVLIYVAQYPIHFAILTKSGPGDRFHSSLFQSTLEDNYHYDKKTDVLVRNNAVITLRTMYGHPNKYLHSHWDLLPQGAGGWHQQVGCYVHLDDNNRWIIRRWDQNVDNSSQSQSEYIRHGDPVILTHQTTGRNLHSHALPSIYDKKLFQVTGYGDDGVGDENDVWILEISGGKTGDVVTPMTSLTLRHKHLHCMLTDTAENLPKEWSFMLSEIGCSPWQRRTKENRGFYDQEWEIVENESLDQSPVYINSLGAGFWFKFKEFHHRMGFMMNRIGSQKQENMGGLDALKWPFNLLSQKFCPDSPRATMVGNPAIYAINIVCMFLFFILAFLRKLKQRKHYVEDPSYNSRSLDACFQLILVYLIHYLPYIPLTRILYIHHYTPAFYFSCILSGVIIDYSIKMLKFPKRFQSLSTGAVMIVLFGVSSYSFIYFSPTVYGMTGTDLENGARLQNSTYHYLHWLDSWNL